MVEPEDENLGSTESRRGGTEMGPPQAGRTAMAQPPIRVGPPAFAPLELRLGELASSENATRYLNRP